MRMNLMPPQKMRHYTPNKVVRDLSLLNSRCKVRLGPK